MKEKKGKISAATQEFELPETVYVRDIEDRVFKAIAIHCISSIEGVQPIEGGFLDQLLGRDSEKIRGVEVTQESETHSVAIKIEVKVRYGVSIPEKSDEIQTKIAQEISAYTGLHVSSVHVVFKNVYKQVPQEELKENIPSINN